MLGHLPLENDLSRCLADQPIARAQAMAAASGLHCRARNRAWRGCLWSALTGRSRRLLKLATVKETCTVAARHYAGMQTVPVSRIRGSEGRSGDFDSEFNPLKDHNAHRWVSIAAARHLGALMPPVDLIQVGNFYFVRDGHHRISVARALGQQDIEAEVTVWQADGPLPWEQPRDVPALVAELGPMELATAQG